MSTENDTTPALVRRDRRFRSVNDQTIHVRIIGWRQLIEFTRDDWDLPIEVAIRGTITDTIIAILETVGTELVCDARETLKREIAAL